MSVVPLVIGRTVVTTPNEFEEKGGRQGKVLLIRNFDNTQLSGDAPNLSYDLRIGAEYKDHRDGWQGALSDNDHITILPGGAIIIETEESLHLPRGMFGYIVPRVKWLQQGVSNTLSKVDPGYNGHLLVTLFNLGKKTMDFPRRERICSLVIHDVSEGVRLYEGDPKRITGAPRQETQWQKVRDTLEANPATIHLVLIVVTALLTIVTLTLAAVELGLFRR